MVKVRLRTSVKDTKERGGMATVRCVLARARLPYQAGNVNVKNEEKVIDRNAKYISDIAAIYPTFKAAHYSRVLGANHVSNTSPVATRRHYSFHHLKPSICSAIWYTQFIPACSSQRRKLLEQSKGRK
jgi:hypothetical protein